jgi:hypothetical protein
MRDIESHRCRGIDARGCAGHRHAPVCVSRSFNFICLNYVVRTIECLCGCALCTVAHIERHSCVRVRAKLRALKILRNC